MRLLLTLVKWTFWLAAAAAAGLFLWVVMIGKGPTEFSGWLLPLLCCSIIASPGLLIHHVRKRTPDS